MLADEINRATPKTQSALLEAMQEHGVSVGNATYSLPEPFFVLATQNPIEMEGTYPLPEAQLDRFFFKLQVTYPSQKELVEILQRTTYGSAQMPSKVADGAWLLGAQALVREVPIASYVMEYAVRLILASHPDNAGRSPGGPAVPTLRGEPARGPGARSWRPRSGRSWRAASTSPMRISAGWPSPRCATG